MSPLDDATLEERSHQRKNKTLFSFKEPAFGNSLRFIPAQKMFF